MWFFIRALFGKVFHSNLESFVFSRHVCLLSTMIRVITVVKMLWTDEAQPSEFTTFWPLWWRVSFSIRIQTTLNHISFFTTISTSKIFFFRVRAEKGIARHIDARSVVWNLIDNGKLANQIAILVAIVVRNNLTRRLNNIYHSDETKYLCCRLPPNFISASLFEIITV